MKTTTPNMSFTCPKCRCNTAKEDIMQATGGTFSKLFNIQNKRFTTKSCTNCGYTEFYSKPTSRGKNILDFFVG